MNEKPKLDPAFDSGISQRLHEGSLFEQAAHGAELEEFLSESPESLSIPKLTLRHPDEFDDEVEAEFEASVGDVTLPTADVPVASDDDDDSWPWNSSDLGGKRASTLVEDQDIELEIPRTPGGRELLAADEDEDADIDRPMDDGVTPALFSAPHHEDDHSAIEDVVLSMPIMQTPIEQTLSAFARDMEETADAYGAGSASNSEDPAEHDIESAEVAESVNLAQDNPPNRPARAVVIAANQPETTPAAESPEVAAVMVAESVTASASRPVATPKRIGSGQLVPARLTWKPGDPFGDSGGASRRRFRWDVMLTSAGITAACGMFCIWVLRTLLA